MKAKQAHPVPVVPSTAQELFADARFAVPEIGVSHVSRPRLVRALAKAGSSPLVLVSGPAGSGKTSLLAEWVHSSGAGPDLVGWITVEEGETALWDYLLDCLSRLGVNVPELSASAGGVLGRPALFSLAEAVAESARRCTIVVDSYEMLSLEVARDVDFLLRHTFGRLRLVLAARVDPVLPLYRYRLSDDLVEIRAADLAFTDDEAAQLFHVLGVRLSTDSVHQLNERVRGWAAGLRFAAQALAAHEDPERSVAAVLAQTENINEYLVGEVLEAQTPEVRRFMLDTCVPDVLCPGLVEELAGAGARHSLVALSRSNAFMEPVPGESGCYSYYPFFREMLRAQQAYESTQRFRELEQTVAGWFKRHGMPDKAIAHLAAISAWDEIAVQIVDGLLVGRLVLEGGSGPMSEVARRLPDLEQRAACVVRAAVALTFGDRIGCADELSRARRTDDVDGARDDTVSLSIAVLEAVRASVADDAPTANTFAEEAQRALADAHLHSGVMPGSELWALVEFSHGMAGLRRGDLGQARRDLTRAAASDAGRSFPWFHANCLGYTALVDALEGQLSRSARTAAESLALLDDAGLSLEDRSPAPYVALARVALEQYDLKAAREHVISAGVCRAQQDNRVARGIAESVMAGLERASGHLQPALARLDAAAAAAEDSDPWLADYLRVEAARLNVASGRAASALKNLEGVGEYDAKEIAVVRASAYAEQGQEAAVAQSLALAAGAETSLRTQVSRLLVEVFEESRRRPPGRTRVVLDRSLRLAAPEQLRRPFREVGPSVQRLLSSDPRLLHEHRWLSGSTPRPHMIPTQRSPLDQRLDAGATSARSAPEVVESLTAKELEVLTHLEELLTTEEIAEKMFVSVNTVRTHIRSILRKLGVNRRNAAVRKARELGLVDG